MSGTEPSVNLHVRADTRKKVGVQINKDEVNVGKEWNSKKSSLWDGQ